MSVNVLALGLNHVSAPVSVRERVSLPEDLVRPALTALREAFGGAVKEAAILSTCNRTELYCAAEPQVAERLPDWLADYNKLDASDLRPHVYLHDRGDAVRHAFRVASGLDSMVLGEPQILGQMKDAVRAADEAGALGTLLHQLFQRTFSVAKEVRSTTAIGTQSVSLAAAAVRLTERVFGDLRSSKVLFIGAGEMIELCATHFAARTLPILGLGMVERATRQRKRKPIVMVDLAVPRDIEPEVAHLDDVYLYSVDDLGAVVQSGTEARLAAVVQAETIIDERVLNFMHWMQVRANVPIIRDLQQTAQAVQAQELERARKMLAKGDSPEAVLEQLAYGLTQKFLHGTLASLNQSEEAERQQLLAWLPRIFPKGSDRR